MATPALQASSNCPQPESDLTAFICCVITSIFQPIKAASEARKSQFFPQPRLFNRLLDRLKCTLTRQENQPPLPDAPQLTTPHVTTPHVRLLRGRSCSRPFLITAPSYPPTCKLVPEDEVHRTHAARHDEKALSLFAETPKSAAQRVVNRAISDVSISSRVTDCLIERRLMMPGNRCDEARLADHATEGAVRSDNHCRLAL